MPDKRRNKLARVLAEMDQLLAAAEEIIELPDCERYRDLVLDRLIEFQERRRDVEAELRGQ